MRRCDNCKSMQFFWRITSHEESRLSCGCRCKFTFSCRQLKQLNLNAQIDLTWRDRFEESKYRYSMQQTKVSYKRFYENIDWVGNVPTTESPSPAIILQEIIIYTTREAARRVTKGCKSGRRRALSKAESGKMSRKKRRSRSRWAKEGQTRLKKEGEEIGRR